MTTIFAYEFVGTVMFRHNEPFSRFLFTAVPGPAVRG